MTWLWVYLIGAALFVLYDLARTETLDKAVRDIDDTFVSALLWPLLLVAVPALLAAWGVRRLRGKSW